MPSLSPHTRSLSLAVALVSLCMGIHAQVIQSTAIAANNSLSVFITDYPEEADLCVFIVDSKNQAIGNNGFWYFQDSQTYADKKIFFVEDSVQADLKINFVDQQELAGWKNKTRKFLLD